MILRLLRIPTAALLAGGLLLSAGDAPAAGGGDDCVDDLENEFEGDPEGIAYGKERFGQRCAFCHGGGGLGAKGPSLVTGKFKRGSCNSDIVENIVAGIPRTQMGAFGLALGFDEILKIVAYMRDEEAKARAAGEID